MIGKTCVAPGCEKQPNGGARGLCSMHYRRMKIHGTLDAPTLVDNFARVEPDPETGCLNWIGPTDGKGYGFFSRPYQGEKRAHRAFWVRANGPIEPGLELDHLCRNRGCVQIDHLEPVTHDENIRRARRGLPGTEMCRAGKHDVTSPDAWKVFPSSKGIRYCKGCLEESYQRGLARRRERRAAS